MTLTDDENTRMHELLNKYKTYSYLTSDEANELQYYLKAASEQDMDVEAKDGLLLLAMFGLGAVAGAAIISAGKK